MDITYRDVHNMTYQASQLLLDDFDYIIGLERGGTIPAALMSRFTKAPLQLIAYSSKQGKGDDVNHSNELPIIIGKSLMIVDDICDSGYTMKEVVEHFEKLCCRVSSFVLVYKEQDLPVFCPDMFGVSIPKNGDWVNFDFEKEGEV